MTDTARRAGRKPSRGGTGNLLCIAEPLAVLAAELPGLANHISVILPWGSLLRALLAPEAAALDDLARLSAPGAVFELVVSYEPARDAREIRRLGIPEIQAAFLMQVVAGAYESAGFGLRAFTTLTPSALAACGTTWAKRLAVGSPRSAWLLRFERKGRGRGADTAGPVQAGREGAEHSPEALYVLKGP